MKKNNSNKKTTHLLNWELKVFVTGESVKK